LNAFFLIVLDMAGTIQPWLFKLWQHSRSPRRLHDNTVGFTTTK
jgi:hypothetical protein